MEKYCFLNDQIIPFSEAKISINDIGILRGFGVFDFLRTYNSETFLVNQHLERLEKSAEMINLKLPIPKNEIKKIINKLIAKNKIKNAGIRIVLTGGPSADGIEWNNKSSTFFVIMKKLPLKDMKIYKEGVKLITIDHQRELPEAKTNNYITKLKSENLKRQEKAHEILYTSKGKVLEGATSNIFMFKNNQLITTKKGILHGTRRWVVLKLAKKEFKIQEKDIKLKELLESGEAFITSTTRDIVPVTKIDNKKISDGKVGKNTKLLMETYEQYVNNHTKG